MLLPQESCLKKIKTALHYVKSTCIIGSSNKVEDIHRTNGWCFFSDFRTQYGHYQRRANDELLSQEDLIHNMSYDPATNSVYTKEYTWWYSTKNEFPQRNTVYVRNNSIDPLADNQFNLTDTHKGVLRAGLMWEKYRNGNCQRLSEVLVKKLWELSAKEVKIIFASLFNRLILFTNLISRYFIGHLI